MPKPRRRTPLPLLAALVCCAVLLTSCLNPVQLNQRAIVQAVGVDLEEDGGIRLTMQVFSPATTGGSISATADNAKIIESTGATVSEAVQNATLLQGKQLFVGHNRIIILGSALAKRGLEQPLGYFASSPWSRQNVHLAVAEERAADILKARINQGMLPAETLEKIIENTEENGMMKGVELYEFLKALDTAHESSILPVMRLDQTQPEGGGPGGGEQGAQDAAKGGGNELDDVSSISIVGTAVFSDAKLAGVLGKEASRGLLWIRGDVRRTILTVSAGAYETAALRVYESKSELTPDFSEGRIRFTLKVGCEAALGESALRSGSSPTIADVEVLARAGETLIAAECRAAFQKAAREYGADIFNLGNLVWQKNAEIWRGLKDDWQEHLNEVDFSVEVRLQLDRVGLDFELAGG